MFTFFCLLCLCGNREYPGRFQNKLVSTSFEWVPKYVLFLECLSMFFLEWTIIDLSSKLSLTCENNKSVHHSIPICGTRDYSGNFRNKSVSFPFNWVHRYILFWAKVKKRRRPFLEGARRRATLWDYPQEHLVVIRNGCKSLSF